MRAYRIAFALIALLAVLALAGPAQAATVDTSAFAKHSGTGWDFYLTDSSQVNVAEVGLVINYAAYQLTLNIQEANQTNPRQSQVVMPHSSELIQIDFPDVQTTYHVTLSYQGTVVYSVDKTRPGYYLPPPKDTWHITPPESVDPNVKYTDVDLTQAILNAVASVTWQVLLITTLVAVFGFAVGAVVKYITKMAYPKDFITWTLLFVLFLDLIGLPIIGHFLGSWNRLWEVPFLFGYLMGFIIWHLPLSAYTKINLAKKFLVTDWMILYFPNDRASPAIADQNNVALFKRLFGVHHYISADSGFFTDWKSASRKPWLPPVIADTMFIEKEATVGKKVKLAWFQVWQYTTALHLSPASAMPKAEFLQSASWFLELGDRFKRLSQELLEERLTGETRAVSAAVEAVSYALSVGPSNAIIPLTRKDELPPDLTDDLGEDTLTTIEAVDAEAQKGIEENDEPEVVDTEKENEERKKEKKKKGAETA